jgi:hypothetical protein
MVGHHALRPQVLDFSAYCNRGGPLKGCEGQFDCALPSCAVEAKIHDCDIPDFSAVLRIEDFSDLLDLDFG